MFKIGEFSKVCRIPTSVLRYYDEIGIFKPDQVDPFTGYRYYSLSQLPRLNRILALRDLDLSLTEIESIMSNQITLEEIKGMLRLKHIQLTQQQSEIQAKLQLVHSRLRQIESENTMPEYEVIVKPAEAMKIASIREIVPTVSQMPVRSSIMFNAIVEWLHGRNQQPAGPALAMYYNPEYVEVDIDVENALIVDSKLETGNFSHSDFTISIREIPPIELVASTIHRGNFDNLINAWQALARWIEQNSYELIHPPSREFYLSGPGEEPVAEVQYLVKRKA